MATKINMNRTHKTTEFVVRDTYLATVKNAVHTINNDEYSLNPKPENFWIIDFKIDDNYYIQKYRIDYSSNLFSKYRIFQKQVKNKLKKDCCDFRSIIGLRLKIVIKRTYILNEETQKWTKDSIIEKMSLIKVENPS